MKQWVLKENDFSSEDFKKIIEHSYLCDRDKKTALLYFIDKKNQNEVWAEMRDIENKKTVNNNISPINDILLDRACEYNNEKN